MDNPGPTNPMALAMEDTTMAVTGAMVATVEVALEIPTEVAIAILLVEIPQDTTDNEFMVTLIALTVVILTKLSISLDIEKIMMSYHLS